MLLVTCEFMATNHSNKGATKKSAHTRFPRRALTHTKRKLFHIFPTYEATFHPFAFTTARYTVLVCVRVHACDLFRLRQHHHRHRRRPTPAAALTKHSRAPTNHKFTWRRAARKSAKSKQTEKVKKCAEQKQQVYCDSEESTRGKPEGSKQEYRAGFKGGNASRGE